MPTRGYRKGLSDGRIAAPRRIHTRLPERIHAALIADAASRGRPASAIIRAIVVAHYTGRRAELPHVERLTDAFLRHYARLGNNLNQLVREAHRMRLPLLVEETRACLAALEAQARAFSSEVGTGSREENAANQKPFTR